MRNRRGARALASKLGIAEGIFAAARLDHSQRFLSDRIVRDPLLLPESKSAYAPALAIAKMVFQQQGLDIRNRAGDVLMPSVLVNMEDVFESYFRTILSMNLNSHDLAVLDGNIAEPAGAARPLFDDADSGIKSNRATPDVLIRKLRPQPSNAMVIEVKYKTSKQPDREDINQVLVYGMVYGCPRVALAYPRRSASEASVAAIGTVAGTEIFKISVDLGTHDLEGEEHRLLAALRLLCQ
jgi:5-methylcytosine-specific restriction enzyme subunit McrC